MRLLQTGFQAKTWSTRQILVRAKFVNFFHTSSEAVFSPGSSAGFAVRGAVYGCGFS